MTGFLCALPLAASLFSACAEPAPFATGYVEGEYVLIAPVASAQIAELSVVRGDRVFAGQPVVELEKRDAEIARAEAKAALAEAESRLANLLHGKRPEEIRVIEAALASAEAQLAEAERAAARLRSLAERGAAAAAQRDDAETAAAVARAKLAETEASLAVARLPSRPEEIGAAEAAVERARATLANAEWQLGQRSLRAPAAGVVDDVLRLPGEIAGPSAPVLSMLPDGATKLRLYVPEASVSSVRLGGRIAVRCDGCPEGLTASITYVADAPEFTPPVIYSIENRQKLVYLIEARPIERGGALKPGQIVDVSLAPVAE